MRKGTGSELANFDALLLGRQGQGEESAPASERRVIADHNSPWRALPDLVGNALAEHRAGEPCRFDFCSVDAGQFLARVIGDGRPVYDMKVEARHKHSVSVAIRVCTSSHLPRLGPVHVWTLNGRDRAFFRSAHSGPVASIAGRIQQPEFPVQCISREEKLSSFMHWLQYPSLLHA